MYVIGIRAQGMWKQEEGNHLLTEFLKLVYIIINYTSYIYEYKKTLLHQLISRQRGGLPVGIFYAIMQSPFIGYSFV